MFRTMLAASVLATIVVAACYSPSLDGNGQFLCDEPAQLCPAGFVCRDALCVREGTDPGRDSGPLPEDMVIPEDDITVPLPEEECWLGKENEIAQCRIGGQFGATVLGETLAVTFTHNLSLLSAVKLPGQKWATWEPLRIPSGGYSAIHLWPNRTFHAYRNEDESLAVISAKYPKPDSDVKTAVLDSSTGLHVSVAPHAENDTLVWIAYQATTTSPTSPRRIARVLLVERDTGKAIYDADIEEPTGSALSGAFVTIATSKQGGTHLAYLSVNSLKNVKVFQSSFDSGTKRWSTPRAIGDQNTLQTELRGVTVAVDNKAHFIYPSNIGLMYDGEPIMLEPPIEGVGKPSLALGDWKVVGFTNMALGAVAYQRAESPWKSLNLEGDQGETTQIQVLTSAPNRYEVFYRKRNGAKATLYHRTLTCGDAAFPHPTEPPVEPEEPNQGE